MAAVMDHFAENGIEYQPESLYYDISKCIGKPFIQQIAQCFGSGRFQSIRILQ